MDHFPLSAAGRVFVLEGIETVGTAGDDGFHFGGGERRAVLFRQGLEEIFISGPPRGIATTAFLRTEDGKLEPGLTEKQGLRLGRASRPMIVSSGAARPEEDFGVGSFSPCAQSPRPCRGRLQGLPVLSTPRNAVCNSAGKRDSVRTR